MRLTASILAAIVTAGSVLAAQTPDAPPQRFRESVSLDTDSSVVKKLGTIDDYLAVQQWAQAIDILAEIANEHGQSLVQVSQGRYLNVGRYTNILLAGLPAEGLAEYRRLVDAPARQRFERGRLDRDTHELKWVIRQAFASSYGDDALLLLGDLAWERGETDLARRYWEQILPRSRAGDSVNPAPMLRYPDTQLDIPTIVARLVLASILEGDLERAHREQAAFDRLYSEARGEIAGRSGRLADILAEEIVAARQWDFRPQEAGVDTFGLNARRNEVLPMGIDVGAALWSADLPAKPIILPERRVALGENRPLSYHTVIFRDIVLLNDADRILAWNVKTGQPAWSDDGQAGPVLYPPVPGGDSPQSFQPTVGIPRYTMTIHDGRLYAKMGTPITLRAVDELAVLRSELVCLDLARGQGKLVWNVEAMIEMGPGWAFEGSPVVSGGRLYVATRRSQPELQTNVACFDADTGRLIWNRKICSAVAGMSDRHNWISHRLLTLADDTLFYSTDTGAIAAIAANDGTVKWVVTYESKVADDHAVLSDHTERGLTPPLYHRGTVIAAPNDSDDVFAIDTESGIVAWRQRLPGGVRHLLGVGRGCLIAAGDDLWGLELERDGRVAWHVGFDDPTAHGYGRGVLAGRMVYWPTREEILVVDQHSGAIRRRIPLAALHGERGGNLTIADGFLLVAQPERLVAFVEYGRPPRPTGDDVVRRKTSVPVFAGLRRRFRQ